MLILRLRADFDQCKLVAGYALSFRPCGIEFFCIEHTLRRNLPLEEILAVLPGSVTLSPTPPPELRLHNSSRLLN